MIVVADSSPLIPLSRVGRLDILEKLFGRLLVPDAVWQEVVVSGSLRPGAEELLRETWIEHRSVEDSVLVNLLRLDLGAGEAEAIVLAREVNADLVLMDERLGRSAAGRLGLRVTGVVGVLLEARSQRIITDPFAVGAELRSRGGFWISDELMELLR